MHTRYVLQMSKPGVLHVAQTGLNVYKLNRSRTYFWTSYKDVGCLIMIIYTTFLNNQTSVKLQQVCVESYMS